MKKKIILLLIISLLSINLFSQTVVEKYGALQVVGKNLCDSSGNPIQLRGLSTHGIQYFELFYNSKLFESISKDWNADVIRIASYINEGWGISGNYLEYPDYWRSKIDTMVSWAEQWGLYVIIDWHMIVPGDPNNFLNEAKEFWTYMSEKHGQKENVLFEICNEPNNDSTWFYENDELVKLKYKNPITWKDNIKKYAEEILPIIRSNSDNIVIVGTEDWASRPDLVIGNELEFDNVMYSVHFYAAEHKDERMQFLKNAVDNDIPLFITEFGTQFTSGDKENDFISSDKWLDYLDFNKISWVNWSLSNDFRSGAIYKRNADLSSLESYSDTANMKEAGIWIYNRLKNDDVAVIKHKSIPLEGLNYKLRNNCLIVNVNDINNYKLSIFNLKGQEVIKQNISTSSVRFSNLKNGMYIIKAIFKDNCINEILTVY